MSKERVEKLREIYGVTKDIPEQKLEIVEESPKAKEKMPEVNEETISQLRITIERADAMLGTFGDLRKATEDRIMQLAGEVGELRSMLLEREKRMGRLEADAEKALDLVGELRPEKIGRRFERNERELLEARAETEKLATLVNDLKKQNEQVSDVLEKIKSFENLVEISRTIDKKRSKMEKTRAYVDRTASKVELIFSELSEKLRDVETQKEKITRLDELGMDIVRMLDEVSIKVQKSTGEEMLKKIKDDVLESVAKKIDGLPKKEEIDRINENLNRLMAKEKPGWEITGGLPTRMEPPPLKLTGVAGEKAAGTKKAKGGKRKKTRLEEIRKAIKKGR